MQRDLSGPSGLLGLVLAGCGAPGPGPACEAYLECSADAGSAGPVELAYGEGSSCWESDETAAACEAGCAEGLLLAEEVWPLVETCDSGDGPAAAAAFTLARRWSYDVDSVAATAPCKEWLFDDAHAQLQVSPASGTAFTGEGLQTSIAYTFRWEADCTTEWGGFRCEPADAGIGAVVSLSGTFSADMLESSATLFMETDDQDPETGEDVPCTFTLALSGTVE